MLPIRIVNTTLTKEPGLKVNNQREVVCLIPFGSANEEISGISHFFEHLIIAFLLGSYRAKGGVVYGHTTEDYIILFAVNLSAQEIWTGFKEIDFAAMPLERYRKTLLKEIDTERSNYEESFFSAVWMGTDYEKSPLGDALRVKEITVTELNGFREHVCRNNLYVYEPNNTAYIITPQWEVVPSRTPRVCSTGKAEKVMDGKHVNLYFFNDQIETSYLLVQILKELNPGKQVQLSEKKGLSVLIMEQGVQYPGPGNIDALRQHAIETIQAEISEIKTNFQETGLNELESLYFYQRPWKERIDQLMTTTSGELLHHPFLALEQL